VCPRLAMSAMGRLAGRYKLRWGDHGRRIEAQWMWKSQPLHTRIGPTWRPLRYRCALDKLNRWRLEHAGVEPSKCDHKRKGGDCCYADALSAHRRPSHVRFPPRRNSQSKIFCMTAFAQGTNVGFGSDSTETKPSTDPSMSVMPPRATDLFCRCETTRRAITCLTHRRKGVEIQPQYSCRSQMRDHLRRGGSRTRAEDESSAR
jgi:hypothetical protein